jgi:hypothetical protein
VNQSSGLECVIGALATHIFVRENAKLSVDQWREFFQRRPVTFAPAAEKYGERL